MDTTWKTNEDIVLGIEDMRKDINKFRDPWWAETCQKIYAKALAKEHSQSEIKILNIFRLSMLRLL